MLTKLPGKEQDYQYNWREKLTQLTGEGKDYFPGEGNVYPSTRRRYCLPHHPESAKLPNYPEKAKIT